MGNLTPEQLAEKEAKAAADKAAKEAKAAADKAAKEAKAAADKAAKEAKAAADKAAKEAKAAADKAAKEAQKVKVNFGVEIPGMGIFTKEQIEADEDIQTMLLEIGSAAVTKL